MNDKYVLILQRSISTLFLLFGIITITFNIINLVTANETQALINTITVFGLLILLIFTYFDKFVCRILQLGILLVSGSFAIIFADQISFVGDGILIVTILLFYVYNILKSFSYKEILVYCIFFIALHAIAGIMDSENFDIYYIIYPIFSLIILIVTFIIFKDYISAYIERNKKNELYLIIGQIAATYIHNLHLETVMGYSDFILLNLKRNNIENAISTLQMQRQVLEQKETLRKSVLNSIRFNRVTEEKVKTSLKALIDSVVTLVTTDEEHLFGAKIKTNVEDVYVNVLPIDIILILHGLIQNAINALYENKIENKIITIATKQEKHFIVIEVQDNGKGFPTTNIDELKSSKQIGGIGLQLTRDILVERYKANIIIGNTTDGAVVSIKLPK